MKNFNFKDYELYQQILDKKKSLLSDQVTRKGGLGLINWFLQVKRLIQAKAPTKSDVKICKHFALMCYKIYKKSGLTFLVKYLKTCYVLLQQYVSRNLTVYSAWEVGSVGVKTNRKGLPRCIPRLQRTLIRRGDTKTIRFWLTLFGFYRYLNCEYKPVSTESIESPGSWLPTDEFRKYVKIFAAHVQKFKTSPLQMAKPFSIEKVTVSIKSESGLKGSSVNAMMQSVWVWRNLLLRNLNKITTFREVKLISSLVHFIREFWPGLRSVFLGIDLIETNLLLTRGLTASQIAFATRFGISMKERVPKPIPTTVYIPEEPFGGLTLGRISILREAAGKKRKIAILDPFTQWLLKPIHDFLFEILNNIPQDGTFNQVNPILRVLDITRQSLDKFLASCDLSDATDRLPSILQRELLIPLIGELNAIAWYNLLCSREYKMGFRPLMYAVGQPMGALSSFASLALTHHFLWQWAAWRSGYTPTWKWFTEYGVLGDDSVSRIHIVVQEYISIIKEIGVVLNLSKSLQSPIGCLEFAKRFMTPKGDCSPISIGEIVVSSVNFSVMSNWPRKHDIRIHDLLAMKGYKHVTLSRVNKPFKKLPRRLKHLFIVLRSPWGSLPFGEFLDWLEMTSYDRSEYIIDPISVLKHIYSDLEKLSKRLDRLEFINSTLVNGEQLRLFRGDLIAKKLGLNLSKISVGDVQALKYFQQKDPLTMGVIFSEVLVPLTMRNDTLIESTRKSVDRLTYQLGVLIQKAEFLSAMKATGAYINIQAPNFTQGVVDRSVVNRAMEEYLKVEDLVNSINPDIVGNNVRINRRIPSPATVCKLWNRYRKRI